MGVRCQLTGDRVKRNKVVIETNLLHSNRNGLQLEIQSLSFVAKLYCLQCAADTLHAVVHTMLMTCIMAHVVGYTSL